MSFTRDLAATLPSLLAVPVGLAILKAAVDRIPKDDSTPIVPIVPEGKDDTTPIVPLIPSLPPTPLVIPPQVPSKIKIDIPEGIIPFFPDTAAGAAEEFAAKDPFAGLAGLKGFGEIKPISFDLATLLKGMK
tara:strand:+ start:67 stop:462 length:396 start_codon:yes stop_codon:yes gene_type:complete